MEGLIGNTPMIKIKIKYKKEIKNIYTKLEYYNYTGSIKDRLAKYIIEESIKDGSLKDNMPIVEATSGNTGISFSALGALYNHEVHIFMPEWASIERVNIMKLYGAKVYLISAASGGFKKTIEEADKLAKKINGFRPNQFSNKKNIEVHYKETGREIVQNLDNIVAFVSGIGTGGTLIGIGKIIKEIFPNSKIIALEPDKMPLLSTGKIIDNHKIEGIGDDFIPDIVDKKIIDEIITINDLDAINMSRILAKKLGLGVGISSGANFIASALTKGKDIVTIFPDDFKKYLSTDLTKEIDKDERLISNQIEILEIKKV